jgi:hypothetical protein
MRHALISKWLLAALLLSAGLANAQFQTPGQRGRGSKLPVSAALLGTNSNKLPIAVGPLSQSYLSSGMIAAAINTQVLTTGTTYTVPTGATQLLITLFGGGGGGGAATSGGSAALSGGGGAGGSLFEFIITGSLASSYTYSLGGIGTAGTCSASPTAAGAGGTTSWTMAFPSWTASTVEAVGNVITDSNGRTEVVVAVTSDAKTGGSPPTWGTTLGASTTDNHVTYVVYQNTPASISTTGGNGGTTASTTTAGNGGSAGSANTTTYLGPNVIIPYQSVGTAGTNGTTSSTTQVGNSNHTPGGNSASVTSGGACSATATPGAPGYIVVQAVGSF